ncbi:hypothetical protein LCGC14_0791630 [marine sediment metagenome]|uniref:Uncharacterized protein n=1 Tax=marine sediment metagenome TaxID=412755 RepID=A0A0F9QC51_9ZZZZ
MATKERILEILAGESGPINQAMLSAKLGEPISSFSTQLNRMVPQGLIDRNEQKEYGLTEEGRTIALREAEAAQAAGLDGAPTGEETEESLKTTEYQQFIGLGTLTGVTPLALIAQIANHIWRGGDYRDLNWVWQGLTEMGIRPDLARRWFHSWRSFLQQAVPAALVSTMGPSPGAEGKPATGGDGAAAGKGLRDYILTGNDTPLRVGEGLGDMDYDDAVKLATVRAAASARVGAQAGQPGQSATPGTMVDEVVKLFNAFKEAQGPQVKGKSYVVKPGENGITVEEVEEGKPMVIASPGPGDNPPTPSYYIDEEGEVRELAPGKPLVIVKQAPPPASSPGKTFIVKQTPEGMVAEEHDMGKPIIINASPPGSNSQTMLPFPVFDGDGQPVVGKDGQPVYANIEPTLRWLNFQGDQRRSDERHNVLMKLAETVRENVGDGIAALKAAAAEAGGGVKQSASSPPQYRCGDCGTQFAAPTGGEWQQVKCPGCPREYTREEILGQ